METFDYKPNSNRSKENEKASKERPKLEKVVKGNIKTKKKSGASKFVETFISEDVKNVKSYLVKDVLIPSAKKLVVDFIKDGIEMLVYGSTRRGDRRATVDKVSYRQYFDRDSRPIEESRSRVHFDYDEIEFDSKGDAELVLTRLDEVIETYGHARVSDLYDLVGKSCDYTCNDYGWSNLSTARAVRMRGGGYCLDMPPAKPIRR